MAFPATVYDSANAAVPVGIPPCLSSTGYVYAFVVTNPAGVANTLSALKSNDPSGTGFVTSAAVSVTSANAINFARGVQDGDLVHFITMDGDPSNSTLRHLRYHRFNMSTESWVVANEAVKLGYDVGAVDYIYGAGGISVRSDGSIVISYNGAKFSSMGSGYGRTFVGVRSSGGTWTIDISLDDETTTNNWLAGSQVLGVSDRVHFFFGKQTSTTPSARHRPYSSAGTFGTVDDVTAVANKAAFKQQPVLHSTDKVTIAYPISSTSVGTFTQTSSATWAAPTTESAIDGTVDVASTAVPACALALYSGALQHLFVSGGTNANDIYFQSKTLPSGSWSTPTAEVSAITTSNVNSAAYTRGGSPVLGILWTDTSGNVYYTEKSLVSGPITHTTSGTLTAGTGAVAGTASSATTRTSSGALSAGTGTVAGTANRTKVHDTSGTLAAGAASLSGTATRFRAHATSGAPTGPGAVLAGTSSSATSRPSSGTLVAGTGTVTGAAARTRAHATSGTLAAGAGTVAGSASRSTAAVTHATSGTLVAGTGTVEGAATRFREHATTGTMVAGTGALSGTADSKTVRTSTGALQASGAVLEGTAARSRVHTTTGALQPAGAVLAGTADSKTTRTATGALQAQGALLAGTASRTRIHVTTGALTAGTGTVSGTSAHGSGKVATGSLAGSGASVAGTASRIRVHAATGSLAGTGASIAGTAQHHSKHTTTGALTGIGALVGTASRTREHVVVGALAGGAALLVASAVRGRVHGSTGTLVGAGASLVGTATLLANIQGTLAAVETGEDVFISRRDLKRQMFAFFH